ncbi:hypothetical protein L484_020375 [Morus notabilis]|uniref:Uncharacterized protein n=1 Tax=Morus notabilis TaxID=981085 RepID=W9RF71_9ROSA|nr:hypothetical protein L484_020375 [Morus notabilis]
MIAEEKGMGLGYGTGGGGRSKQGEAVSLSLSLSVDDRICYPGSINGSSGSTTPSSFSGKVVEMNLEMMEKRLRRKFMALL